MIDIKMTARPHVHPYRMSIRRMPRVKSVMTPFPHSVDGKATLAETRRFMQVHQIRHLPVTSVGKLVGVVTDRDIKLALGPDFDCPSPDEMTVDDIYVSNAYVVDLETPLDDVLLGMAERHIGSALVTRKGKLAGIFTAIDACRTFGEHLREQFKTSGKSPA